jgi:hypothetical protein
MHSLLQIAVRHALHVFVVGFLQMWHISDIGAEMRLSTILSTRCSCVLIWGDILNNIIKK